MAIKKAHLILAISATKLAQGSAGYILDGRANKAVAAANPQASTNSSEKLLTIIILGKLSGPDKKFVLLGYLKSANTAASTSCSLALIVDDNAGSVSERSFLIHTLT